MKWIKSKSDSEGSIPPLVNSDFVTYFNVHAVTGKINDKTGIAESFNFRLMALLSNSQSVCIYESSCYENIKYIANGLFAFFKYEDEPAGFREWRLFDVDDELEKMS